MAATIRAFYHPANTLYSHIRNKSGAVWNGSAFEAYNASNWGNYDIALTEDGSSGYYKATFPGAISAGSYDLVVYLQVGGSPAEGDNMLGGRSIKYDGTDEVDVLSSEIATSVWGAARASYLTDGTFGQMLQSIRSGTAQAGASGTITLDVSASASDDFYNNCVIQIISGTGANQSRIISDYVGSTKVATIDTNWVTNPDNTSVFLITPFGSIPGATAPTAGQVADAVWDEPRSGHTTGGTFGEGVLAESLNTQAKADVNVECDSSIETYRLDELISAAASPSTPTINSFIDKMMNKNSGQTFSAATDSLEAIKDLGSGPTAGDVANEVWQHSLDGTDPLNSAGERLRAIDEKLPSGSISDFDESSNKVNLNDDQSTVTVKQVNQFGTTAKGEINAEMVDVVATDAIPELTAGAPASTPTMRTALMLLYMALRDKSTNSGTEFKIFNNAGTAIAKATVSDDTVTFTREQLGAP